MISLRIEYSKGHETLRLDSYYESMNISKMNITALGKSIVDFTWLTFLSIDRNKLTELPKDIGNLRNLTKFYARKNALVSLPDSIGNLARLEVIDLSCNNLTKLPDSIGNLARLQIINLDFNKLNKLPDSIGNLNSLRVLNLSYNKITELSGSIMVLKRLNSIGAVENSLTRLPKFAGYVGGLSEIFVDNNKSLEINVSLAYILNSRHSPIAFCLYGGLPASFLLLNKSRIGDKFLTKCGKCCKKYCKISSSAVKIHSCIRD